MYCIKANKDISNFPCLLGSVLGPNESENISVLDLRCHGGEMSLDECKYRQGECPSNNYVTVYCTENPIEENGQLSPIMVLCFVFKISYTSL